MADAPQNHRHLLTDLNRPLFSMGEKFLHRLFNDDSPACPWLRLPCRRSDTVLWKVPTVSPRNPCPMIGHICLQKIHTKCSPHIIVIHVDFTSFKDEVRIVSCDLQPMAPIKHVHQLEGDITRLETADRILKKFKGQRA